jgi:hypothetical protein
LNHNVLQRHRVGRAVDWLAPDEANPFLVQDTDPIRNVITDNFGHRLFLNNRRIIAVADHPPVENFALTAAEVAVGHPAYDTASLRFTGALTDGDTLRWRRAGEDWGAWGLDPTLTVNNLLAGEYTVEIQKMDKWLNVSPPATIKFSVKYDTNKLAREAVEKLFSKNWDERNAAVKTLARFPKEAREILQKLDADRDRLNNADRWWLDAALQQVGNR